MTSNIPTSRVTLTELEMIEIYQDNLSTELREKMRKELIKINTGVKTTRTISAAKVTSMEIQLGFEEIKTLSLQELISAEGQLPIKSTKNKNSPIIPSIMIGGIPYESIYSYKAMHGLLDENEQKIFDATDPDKLMRAQTGINLENYKEKLPDLKQQESALKFMLDEQENKMKEKKKAREDLEEFLNLNPQFKESKE